MYRQFFSRYYGYHLLLREHARKTVERPADIPAPRLKIGPAEILRSIPARIYYGPKLRAPIIESVINQEQVIYDFDGPFITEEQFPFEGYKGENLYRF